MDPHTGVVHISVARDSAVVRGYKDIDCDNTLFGFTQEDAAVIEVDRVDTSGDVGDTLG